MFQTEDEQKNHVNDTNINVIKRRIEEKIRKINLPASCVPSPTASRMSVMSMR